MREPEVQNEPSINLQRFHQSPIRAFVSRVRETPTDADDIDDLLGTVVFGNVVRGAADRRSDIECFVVVDGDRTAAHRRITDVVADLRTDRFDGDRFVFEPYVEAAESARRAGSQLREILADGITVYGSDRLDSLRKAVVTGE